MTEAYKGQKRTSDSLELELEMFVRHQVDAGNQTGVLCNNSKCSSPLSHLSSSLLELFQHFFLISLLPYK